MSKEHRGTSAYDDPGTPEEITRRTFMANATVVLGGVIGLGLAIPIIGSLIPKSGEGSGSCSPLDPTEWKQLQASTQDKPVKIGFSVLGKDAYLPEASSPETVWGIKVDPARFKKARPDLFGNADPAARVPYPPINMGFVLFSPICPHLGCFYNYDASANRFQCPCHGSQYDIDGAVTHGPAARGLDPLPMCEKNGQAAVTWIRYAPTVPDRIVVSYTS